MRRFITLCFCGAFLSVGCGKKNDSPALTVTDPATPHVSVLKQGSPAERLAAMQALAALGEQAQSAVPQLEHFANDADEKTRHEAAIALQAIAPDNSIGRSGITLLRLKLIGQAMLKQTAANQGVFPATCTLVASKDGKQPARPGLSWRVLLLPYLDQKELFDQFKLDEPWDSEHNRKLVEKMPTVYAPPKGSTSESKSGETHLQVFTYASPAGIAAGTSIFEHPASLARGKSRPCRIGDVADGTAATFLIVESAKPVIWTKPEDVVVSDAPLPALGHAVDELFHVCMADGAVLKLSRRATAGALRAAIGRADGRVFDLDAMIPDKTPTTAKETTPVLGRVVLKGVPLATGWVVLHTEDGREYGGPIGVAGSFLVKEVPIGQVRATIAQGDPYSEWLANPKAKLPFGVRPLVANVYMDKYRTPLRIDVKAGGKEITLNLN